jgi:hypothetical protein
LLDSRTSSPKLDPTIHLMGTVIYYPTLIVTSACGFFLFWIFKILIQKYSLFIGWDEQRLKHLRYLKKIKKMRNFKIFYKQTIKHCTNEINKDCPYEKGGSWDPE